jgi:flagellin-like hook-associated protein FlgL
MAINTNIHALAAQRHLAANSRAAEKSTAKLASGLKIVQAADDAAGLAISEKMRAQIRGLAMADKNVGHAIDLLNTADGGTSQMHEILQRMRELCVQAGNGTYTDEDREFIQMEINELKKELVRLYNCTEYNEKKVLKGGFSASSPPPVLKTFDVSEVLQPSYPTGALANIDGRGIAFSLVSDGLNITITARDGNPGPVLDTRTVPLAPSLPAKVWQDQYGGDSWDTGKSVIPYNGGYVVVGNTGGGGGDLLGYLGGNADGFILFLDAAGKPTGADRFGGNMYDLINKIVPTADGGFLTIGRLGGQADGLCVRRYDANMNLSNEWVRGNLVDFDGADIIPLPGGDFITLGYFLDNGSYRDVLRRYNVSGNNIAQAWERPLGPANSATLPTGSICRANVNGIDCVVAVDNDLKKVTAVSVANGATIGEWDFGNGSLGPLDFSRISTANDGSFYLGGAGMAAKVTLVPGNTEISIASKLDLPGKTITKIAQQNGQILLAGSDSSSGNSDGWLAGLIDGPGGLAVNMTSTGQPLGGSGSDIAYDVVFNADGSFLVVGETTSPSSEVPDGSSATGGGRNIWVSIYQPVVSVPVANPERVPMSLPDLDMGSGLTLRFDAVEAVFDGGAALGVPDRIEIKATLLGTPDPAAYGARRLWIQTAANTGDGFYVRLPDMSLGKMSLETDPVVVPQERALEAIAYVDRAINYVSSERALLGENINRLEYTRDKNTAAAENTQAAQARIRDADMAREASLFAKNNIKIQAAQSVLAQSRQWPQRVLDLLG